jgi:DNA-binding response OmpR family regulator
MKTKVLVVDDSEMVLEATQLVLEDAGLDVVTLSSPALFPVTLNRQKPDLVMLDVGMPIMGGDSLVELARKNQLHQCPIVLYSDRSEKALQALVIACGAQGYVKKTSDPTALMAAVRKFLPSASEDAQQSDEVFLVDDQKMIRALLEEHLRRAGCTPVMLDSAEKCLELAEAKPPSMIIFDLNLAGMRGDEACRKLRANPRLRGVPVVIMTARTKPAEALRWWECGADDFIPKPVRPDQLEAKIRAVRGQRPAMGNSDKGQRILLAVADPGARNRIGLILECSGYRVRYAGSAVEVKAAAEDPADTFDSAVVDAGLLMPEWQPLVEKVRSKIRWSLWLLPEGLPKHVRDAISSGESTATVEHHLGPELVLARLNVLCKRVAADLRAVERVPFYAGVEFRREPQAPWDSGFAHDLSPTGLFVRTLTPAPRGSTVEFRILDLPDGAAIMGRGLVAWSNDYGHRTTYSYPVGMGLQLNALDGPTQKRTQAAYDAAKKAAQGAR